MLIKKAHIDDLTELQDLFIATVREVCKFDYNHEQINVWTSNVENVQRWTKMLTNQFVLVAQKNNQIVGFCALDKGNYIDFLYVHKNYQKQGVAFRLYTEIKKEARRQAQTQLTADVSKTAKPFFEKIGFRVSTEQKVERQGITLTNYKMIKTLAANESYLLNSNKH